MNPLFQALSDRHQQMLHLWDLDLPADQGAPLAERRLRRSAALLIASGPVGLQAAAALLCLPLGQLTLVGLHAADVAPLVGLLEQPARRAEAVSVAPQALLLSGLSVMLSRHHALLVAEGRPHPDVLEQINAASQRSGTPWTHVCLWGAELLLGPTVLPGATACYHCCARRLAANERRPDAARATDAFLRNDPAFEFQGQIAPLTRMAAAYGAAELARLLHGSPAPVALSRRLSADALTQTTACDFIPPLEWCPVCGGHRLEGAAAHETLAAMIERARERQEERAYAAG